MGYELIDIISNEPDKGENSGIKSCTIQNFRLILKFHTKLHKSDFTISTTIAQIIFNFLDWFYEKVYPRMRELSRVMTTILCVNGFYDIDCDHFTENFALAKIPEKGILSSNTQ